MFYTDLTLPALQSLAIQQAKTAARNSVLALHGDLGVGKTTFARYFINYFLPNKVVVSPTFNIVRVYDAPLFKIWHFDLYRLKDPQEAIEVGILESYQEGVAIIEWPELVKDLLPKTSTHIHLARTFHIDQPLHKTTL